MNKTRKNISAITRSDPLVLSGNGMKVEVKTDKVSKVHDLGHENPPIWEPFNRNSVNDENTWFLVTHDLLHKFDALAKFFRFEIMHRSWVNAYLLAAGMDQVVEDYLHSHYLQLLKIARSIEKIPGPVGALLAKTSRFFIILWAMLIGRKPALRKIMTWRHKLTDILDRLAAIIINHGSTDQGVTNRLVADGGSLMAYVPYFPVALRESIIRLPSSFRSSDQQPEDIQRIVDEFSIHCTSEEFPHSTDFIWEIFSVQDNGRLGALWQTIKLYVRNGRHFHVSP